MEATNNKKKQIHKEKNETNKLKICIHMVKMFHFFFLLLSLNFAVNCHKSNSCIHSETLLLPKMIFFSFCSNNNNKKPKNFQLQKGEIHFSISHTIIAILDSISRQLQCTLDPLNWGTILFSSFLFIFDCLC